MKNISKSSNKLVIAIAKLIKFSFFICFLPYDKGKFEGKGYNL
nr:MAG TPA: hypothetical protein [Caudoviricetes sp.]